MSKILTAYNAIKPLPPEGSDEWLAMLPGWQGWVFDKAAFFWGEGHENYPGDVNIGIDYYADWCYGGRGIPCRSGSILHIPLNEILHLSNGTPYIHYAGSGSSYCGGSCYIFRGPLKVPNGNGGASFYSIGWATSLTPQR